MKNYSQHSLLQYIKFFLLLMLIGYIPKSYAQEKVIQFQDSIVWNEDNQAPSFQDALFTNQGLPIYTYRFPVSSDGTLTVDWTSQSFEECDYTDGIPNSIQITTRVSKDRNQYYGQISFVPIEQNRGIARKLKEFELQITHSPTNAIQTDFRTNTFVSKLSDGAIYKIAIPEAGIYKLDRSFLAELGLNIDNVDPRKIQILGNGSGILPEAIATDRIDDIKENAIYFKGENDGSIDNGDYILFYAEAADKTIFNTAKKVFSTKKNTYETQGYYFLKVGNENGLRIQNVNSLPENNSTYTTKQFDNYQHFEEDKQNLLHEYAYGSGSGRQWFGDRFNGNSEANYRFTFDQVIPNTDAFVEANMVARKHNSSFASKSYFYLTVGQNQFKSSGMSTVNTFYVEGEYARRGSIFRNFDVQSNQIDVEIKYNEPGATAWLDYITVNVQSPLQLNGKPLTFRSIPSLAHQFSTFQLSNTNTNTLVWDITNPTLVFGQQGNVNGQQFTFTTNTKQLKTFIAFDETMDFPSPIAIGKIDNQNLHQIQNAEVLIVYPKAFETAAQQLADHRRQHSGFDVKLASIEQIYNEFSSGKKDPVALRDFVRMVYLRDNKLNYLVLLGDGSFDARNIYQLDNPSDFIPVYETRESLAPIFAFPSDDFYALLDEHEGGNLQGALDIAVGRLPVHSNQEALNVVQKIIRYETTPEGLGNWRNNITYVADDQDLNTHIDQADGIATFVDTTYQNLNLNKIYFDAFRQESSSGGNTYPDVKSSINSSVFKGQLVINYLGHGSSSSWAQERVLQETDIKNWDNPNKLPLFVTATCSFTPYDNPSKVSAGEKVFLKSNGGGIGLFTTVRSVFSFSNERLTRVVFEHLFEKKNGVYPPLGEVMRSAKNFNSADTLSANARKFTMIGDPSMTLALPKYQVATESINGQLSAQDTLSALEEVNITGSITDNNQQVVSNFNGNIFVTVFDKPSKVQTLRNDSDSQLKTFLLQKNILFKGKASVKNGQFSIRFIIPKDIDYEFGQGRISYYASDLTSNVDAAGAYEKIIIGGTVKNGIQDDTPPNIQVFIDNEQFAFGGITNQNPTLFIKLSDDYGMNVAGTGLGHDLTATIDGNEQEAIILNDFYESETDNFTKGVVKYPLKDIKTGRHSVKIKGWDIANNSGEGYTEFVVASDEETVIKHVLNYPNPFTSQTEFQFEQNSTQQFIDVQIQIYTVAGNLVKTLQKDVIPTQSRVTGIQWDGKDDFGDKLGKGVYLYRVSITESNENGSKTTRSSSFQKLVILK